MEGKYHSVVYFRTGAELTGGQQMMMGHGGGDPYFASVVMLAMNNNKANNSTTFADQAADPSTITVYGNAKYSTASAPTGMTSSGLFDGAGDYLTAPDKAALQMGSGDFTVEFMLNATNFANAFLTDKGNTDAGGWRLFQNATTGRITVAVAGLTAISDAGSPSTGTWYHIALTRSGTSLKLFRAGAQIGSTATNSTNFNATLPLAIAARESDAGFSLDGYMSNYRITKGVARYTGAFTPPTLPFPAHG